MMRHPGTLLSPKFGKKTSYLPWHMNKSNYCCMKPVASRVSANVG
jgi:hypothetical protein